MNSHETAMDKNPRQAPTEGPEDDGQPKSRLLKLPAELRNQIYFHALAPMTRVGFEYDRTLRVPSRSDDAYGRRWGRRLGGRRVKFCSSKIRGISLLLASKQISKEAATILYGTIHFMIRDDPGPFLSIIGPANALNIRHIILCGNVAGFDRDYDLALLLEDRGIYSPEELDDRRKDHEERCQKGHQRRKIIAQACSKLVSLEVHIVSGILYDSAWRPSSGTTPTINEKRLENFRSAQINVQKDLCKARIPTLRTITLAIKGERDELCNDLWPNALRGAKKQGWNIKFLQERWHRTCANFQVYWGHEETDIIDDVDKFIANIEAKRGMREERVAT